MSSATKRPASEDEVAPTEILGLAAKKPRVEDAPSMTSAEETVSAAPELPAQGSAEAQKEGLEEKDVGISEYLDSSLPAFTGIIKQRFTDFQVFEVGMDGEVTHLTTLDPPGALLAELEKERAAQSGAAPEGADGKAEGKVEKEEKPKETFTWPEGADVRLSPFFSSEQLATFRTMYESGPKPPAPVPRSVTSNVLEAKEKRTECHQLVREVFDGRLATEATDIAPKNPAGDAEDDEDARANASKGEPQFAISVRWASRQDRPRRAAESDSSHFPPYIHFHLQKTNRDNQDALGVISRALGLKGVKDLSVAGTKDKRGVTVQRVAFRRGRRTVEDVWKAVNGIGRDRDQGGGRERGRARGRGGRDGGGGNRKTISQAISERGDRGVRISDLRYADEPLGLGQLKGNEFVITLRNVKVDDESVIHKALESTKEKGFINYYGMQRFGTSTISTHAIGLAIFKADWAEAMSLVMRPRESDSGDVELARQAYSEDRIKDALELMPRMCVAERAVLEALQKGRGSKTNHLGAFTAIPRTLRLIYVHAYQSYIWNRMVSYRIQKFGASAPVVGDLVLLEGQDDAEVVDEDAEETDENAASSVDPHAVKVKILTEEDLPNYTIHDVVMPLPGSEISYPAGWMADKYAEMLAEDGMTPADMSSSKQKEYSLRGAYRKILHKPTSVSWDLIRYTDPDVSLSLSDEERHLGEPAPVSEPEGAFLALQVRFILPTSAYATMALREVLKTDTSVTAQRALTRNSEDQAWRGTGFGSSGGRGGRDVNHIMGPRVRQWGAKPAAAGDEGATATDAPAAQPKEDGVEMSVEVSSAAADALRAAKEAAAANGASEPAEKSGVDIEGEE